MSTDYLEDIPETRLFCQLSTYVAPGVCKTMLEFDRNCALWPEETKVELLGNKEAL